jgi:hypothetical protein
MPCPRSLLGAIKRLLQLTYQRLVLHKSLGLLQIDLLREIIMKKCILHIHLMEFSSLGCHNGKFQTYGIHLHYWRKGLIIFNSMHLLKAFGNNSRFVSTNMSIQCALGLVDPSASDKFPSRRKGNWIPSLVLEEGVVLLLHGRFPKWISSSLTIRLWI